MLFDVTRSTCKMDLQTDPGLVDFTCILCLNSKKQTKLYFEVLRHRPYLGTVMTVVSVFHSQPFVILQCFGVTLAQEEQISKVLVLGPRPNRSWKKRPS